MQITDEMKKQVQMQKRNLTTVVKVADLENFEVFATVPCYKRMVVAEPNYFIDLNTSINVGQEIRLAVYPDGSFEQSHYALYSPTEDKQIVLQTDDIPFTKEYKNSLSE